ncbi:receptor-interacting serine threonine-protein kinase 1 [Lasius niger]|uniref:Receptor-interacting serine threonine-protein kinase 1 n=1 Tax=Lasius niger TaxID=67767 RepID=A0A0J7NTV3_LASNI|nr:receptor-interacting serine threonine-protein kinase 1 [Lasius niger]
MPILSQLSRRFHDMLTTDAKPDPPRTGIEGYTHNLPPTSDEELKKTQSKSAPITPEKEHDDDVTMQQQKSVPNDARPTTPTDFDTKPEDLGDTRSTSESKEYKRPRTKTKSKHSKYSQATNVINYNIVNSNGVKIGSRTSYICNVNQYPASNNASAAQPEAKSKFRSMPDNVEELTTCEEELTFDDMLIIKTHVGHGWRDVARRLSYSDGQIEQFEENYRHKGIDEVNIFNSVL